MISISAGNHAQALAYASAAEGIDALVVMWRDASAQKIAAARGYGATVDTEAPGSPEAFERLEELRRETGRTLVHPFDDPLVIAGQGTVGLEIVEDLPDVDVVLVQVGGGGLVSGIATAVKALRPDARVVAVEPELSPALHDSLRAGRPVRVQPKSIADGLAGPVRGRPRRGDLRRARRRDGARHRGRAARRVPLPLRARQARVRGRRSRHDGRSPGRQGGPRAGARRSPPSSRAATWRPKRRLLFWPRDEDRTFTPSTCSQPCTARAATPSRPARPRRISTSRSAPRATRSTPASRSSWTPVDGSSASSAASRRPAARAAARRAAPPVKPLLLAALRLQNAATIGGQAVLEGVMMRGPSAWALAVRTPWGEIAEENHPIRSPMARHRFLRLPVIRGVIALGESLAIGFRALAISANYAAKERARRRTEDTVKEADRADQGPADLRLRARDRLRAHALQGHAGAADELAADRRDRLVRRRRGRDPRRHLHRATSP